MDSTTVIFDCPLPIWLAAPAAGVLVIAALTFIHRDAARLGRKVRYFILSLAAVAALMLAGLLLSPKLIRTWPDPQKPRCSVLVDGSRSMLLTDAYSGESAKWLDEHLSVRDDEEAADPPPEDDPSARDRSGEARAPDGAREYARESIAQTLLDRTDSGWLAALKEDFDVSGWRFAAALDGLALDADAPPYEVNPEGYSTALGEAIQQASSGSGGSRPRAAILISDGAWNTGRDPSEVARVLGRQGIPVYVVGVGNPTPVRDAAVLALTAPKSVLLGDDMLLTAKVATTGMGARRVPVQLANSGELVEEKQVVTLPSGQPITISFSFSPQEPCRQHLTVRIPKQPDEQDESNNEASAVVEVVERTIHVLLIDGEPRWEFRFIRNVLERDRTVELTICLIRPGVGPIDGPGYVGSLPIEKKDLAAYDLVILGDVPRRSLPDRFLQGLAEMVKGRSGALIVIAGRRGHYRDLADTPIHEILPVKLDGIDSRRRGGAPFEVELTEGGASHLVTRLSPDPEENALEWSNLPPMQWAAEVSGVARGAECLLAHPHRRAGTSRLPLMAVHRVGGGKVMFSGVEETWRWRKTVGDKYHYRFWAQAVRWMVKQPFAEGDPRARLWASRTECSVGENVDIEACCLGPDGFPLDEARVWLSVAHDSGWSEQLVMEPSAGGWGIYRTTFTPDRSGTFLMRPVVSVYGEEPLSSSASLEVSRPDLERNFLAQDRNMLESIAQASGGKYLQINEAERLPAMLAATVEKRFLTAEYSPCRHWIYYTFLALILGVAWSVRKRSGLA